ncbi:hypothetical protein CLOM_g6334 [Closterium sp. NIES-68]|nr:hypothetical protein CLOM_g6334 [Closterium sp. NIES-68]GJP64710.1 hypothetical protein CLOP_g21670 [Closterium sp. NIES-67]
MAEAAERNEQQRAAAAVLRQHDSTMTNPGDNAVTRQDGTSGEERCVAFEVRATDGDARVGRILATRVGDAGRGGDQMRDTEGQGGTQSDAEWFEVATPGLLAYTRRGLPLHLTPDVMQTLGFAGWNACSVHFLESPSHQTIAAHTRARTPSPSAPSHPPPSTRLPPSGLHGFLSLAPATLLLSSPRDSLLFPGCKEGGKASARPATWFDTPSGRRQVTAEGHSAIVASLLPHVAIPLHDAPPATSSLNRQRVAVERSLTWLDEELRLAEGRAQHRTAMLGAVVGGRFHDERRRSARETAARKGLAGYHLAGFGLGEPMDERDALLAAALSELPPEGLRHTSGLNTPEEVLQGVAMGVDLVDCTYPHDLTLLGLASTLPLLPPWWGDVVGTGEGGQGAKGQAAAIGGKMDGWVEEETSKLNLRCTWHKRSFVPIAPACACYTCARHTRAYVHHLLDAHEMLALVLLDIHNHHHMLQFLAVIRQAISLGVFQRYRQWFVRARHHEAQSLVTAV